MGWKFSKFRPAVQRNKFQNKKFFFLIELKYLQFTIEVYGKKGYIGLYHT